MVKVMIMEIILKIAITMAIVMVIVMGKMLANSICNVGSGKQLWYRTTPLVIKHSCGKSPSLMGKLTINGDVQ